MAGECTIVTVERQLTAVIKADVPMPEIGQAQRSARATIAAALPALGAGTVGQSCTLWRPSGAGKLYMEMGVIVSQPFAPAGEIMPAELPAGRAAHFLLVGPYSGLPGAWQTILSWCTNEGHTLANINWEIYRDNSDPAKTESALYVLLA